jgi:cytochrome c553
MNRERILSVHNRWSTVSIGLVAAVVIVSAIVGFVWLPRHQPGVRFTGVWNAICSAAGLIYFPPSAEPVVQATYQTTRVEVIPQMLRDASAESIGRGATLALRCTMCHGARGLSQAKVPNLAGQYPVAIYKQLKDFKSGARVSAVMGPLVADLSDSDMRELAAYYAYLPRVPGDYATGEPPQIVADGAPLRNIAPCGACHGDLGHMASAPWLEGQPADYLRAQLEEFASGARHNDIGEQMRNVVRGMTPPEIAVASQFYASRP